MNLYSAHYPYPSARTAVYARNGVVASSHYLASQAGLDILKQGGNAIDAAIACAACLTVTEPTSNGIGGDAFALIWYKNKLYGLNASGPAPSQLTAEMLLRQGYTQIPARSWAAVTVPGLPAAWSALSGRFGHKSLAQCLAQAIIYADNGYPVSPVISRNWHAYYTEMCAEAQGELYQEWYKLFAPHGRSPLPGEIWRSPELARTLNTIAESNSADFYHGDLAATICHYAQKTGGYLQPADFANYQVEWVEPLSTAYHGHTIWELPPNGHGLIVLLALNILKQFDFTSMDENRKTHIALEAMKLAFADGYAYIGDPRFTDIPLNDLLSDAYSLERSKQIGDRALSPQPGQPLSGGTVYLATADSDGNMVSFIQSNYTGFGSGIVVPGTGIALHNRGRSFSFERTHPNFLEPQKRPYHTIIPGFMTKDGLAVGPFGVMGAMMQPQGHVQTVINTIDRGLNPQAALDYPRWQWVYPDQVYVENSFPSDIVNFLAQQGHNISFSTNTASFGRGQIIFSDPERAIYVCGTEPRADSLAACW